MSKTTFLSANPACIRSRKGAKVDRIIIHTMEGTFKGTQSWFQKAGRPVPTAAHYLISVDGDICQMVPDENAALHCGSKTEAGWNQRSIGIEHEGFAKEQQFSLPMLSSSAKVVAIMAKKFDIPCDRIHIIGHNEVPGVTHTDPGDHWPWEQYISLVRGHLEV